MTRAEKADAIEELKGKFEHTQFFYITDASTLSVEKINMFRKLCFEKDIEMKVVKNTLAIKALETYPEDRGYAPLKDALKGPSAILFTQTANLPAKLLKQFRAENEKPVLKAAYIDSDIYFGDDQIEVLVNLKSKEDLLGEIVTILQSPAKNVISALKSGGQTIAGLIKTLSERSENG